MCFQHVKTTHVKPVISELGVVPQTALLYRGSGVLIIGSMSSQLVDLMPYSFFYGFTMIS